MIKCSDCRKMTENYRTWNTHRRGDFLICNHCYRERILKARGQKPRQKKQPGQSSLPKHLQPAFVPMSRSRTGKKRQGFY